MNKNNKKDFWARSGPGPGSGLGTGSPDWFTGLGANPSRTASWETWTGSGPGYRQRQSCRWTKINPELPGSSKFLTQFLTRLVWFGSEPAGTGSLNTFLICAENKSKHLNPQLDVLNFFRFTQNNLLNETKQS